MANLDESTARHHNQSGVRQTRVSRPGAAPAEVSRRLARFLFDLQADEYGAGDAMRELAWADDRIHDFWLGQARAVVAFLGLDLCV